MILTPHHIRPKIAADDWWLAGGISSANCLAAYQPKGASSLSESYVNIANPGTYDCVEISGVVAPTLISGGWSFPGSYVDNKANRISTGIATAQSLTLIVRVADVESSNTVTVNIAIGAFNGTARQYVSPIYTVDNKRGYGYGNASNIRASGTAITDGVLALAGTNCYVNKTSDGTAGTWVNPASTITIGGAEYVIGGGTALKGTVVCAAIYNVVLTFSEVADVTDAMNAL